MFPHFLGFFGLGIRHTTTLPLSLHLGFLRFGTPSGETPASSITGKNNPIRKNVENSFFTTKEPQPQ